MNAGRSSARLIVGRSVAARAFSFAATLAMSVLASRELGASGAGYFFTLIAVVMAAATVGRFGTDNLGLKLAAGESPNLRTDVGRLLTICVCTSLAATVVLASAAPAIRVVVGRSSATTDLLPLSSLAITPLALSVFVGAILRARGCVASGTVSELGSAPGLTSLALVSPWTPNALSLQEIITIFVCASWATSAWSLLLAATVVRGRSGVSASQSSTLAFIHVHTIKLAAMMGTSLLFYLLTWAPVFALATVSTSTHVAYYAVSARLAAFITLVPTIQTSYLAPRFAAFHKMDDVVPLNATCQSSTRRALQLAFLPTLVLLIFPGPALRLFGDDFQSAGLTLRILAGGALVVVAIGQVNPLMLICDMERFAFVLNLALLGLWILLGSMMGYIFGATGVAVVSAITLPAYAIVASIALFKTRNIISGIVTAKFPALQGVSR